MFHVKQFTSKTQKIGETGEEKAAVYLRSRGFAIVGRNIANKYGEIDIVAKKGGTYYFFEVKAGKKGGWINPAENLTKTKLRKVLVSAEHYALVHNIKDYCVQGIVVLLENGQGSVEVVDIF